jgi:tellurite methyltransferase
MSEQEREKWNAIHTERGFFPTEPSALITACRRFLPDVGNGGRGLDVAGGTGRHALWLATACGFAMTLVDISEAALRMASREAHERGVALETIGADLECDPFPTGPWDVILCFHYLQRALFDRFAPSLSSRGVLLFAQPTVRNLERHSRPSARFLLEEGELEKLASQAGLEIIFHDEGWSAEGRHESLIVAKRRRKWDGMAWECRGTSGYGSPIHPRDDEPRATFSLPEQCFRSGGRFSAAARVLLCDEQT